MTTSATSQPSATEMMYDDIGVAYEAAFEGLQPQIASIEWLKTRLEARKPAKFLDVGCGTGKPVCYQLANAGHDVLGIDLSGAMISAARKNAPKARFEKADIATYNAPAGSFDAISAYFSMLAGVSQDNIRLYISRIFDWLNSGGSFVFATVPIDENQVDIKWMGRDVNVSSLSTDAIIAHMERVGFEILYQNISSFTPSAVEAGICNSEDVWEETHLFVYAKKP